MELTSMYWSSVTYTQGELVVAATEHGLCFVGSVDAGVEELINWQQKKRPQLTLMQNNEKLKLYRDWLQQYFAGENPLISFEVDLQGTAFQEKVWQALQQIPYGETRTYLQIAELIQNKAAIRAVGRAIGANPVAIVVPCHRVIGKNGALTGFRGGLPMKKYLLEVENISK